MGILLEVLHVAGAVFVVGPMVLLPMFALRAIRAGDGAQVRRFANSALGFGIATLVVGALGFGVMATTDPSENLSISTGWILVSVIAFAAAIVIHLAVVVPALRNADRDKGERSFGYALVATTSGTVAILLVLVVVLMITRPF